MQKYKNGDHVMVAKDLGASMRHFDCDCEAIVMGSYADKYGGTNTSSYTIYMQGRGSVSWYDETQLNLIHADKLDLLKEWTDADKLKSDMESNIDWIFSHGKEVLVHASEASVTTLADGLGINLWGSRGEGIVYYENALSTLELAKPFLLSGDKDGWLKYITENRK